MRGTTNELFKLLGFRNSSDLLSGVFGFQAYSLPVFKYLMGGTVLAATTAFCTRWIWNPPSAIALLLFLDLANGRYGYQVAKKLRGESFKWEQFQRLGGVLIATIIVMGIVRNAINSYPYYDFLADLVFGWLFATKAKKVVAKMVALKVQEEGAASIFQQAISALLRSKFGDMLVDGAQPRRSEPSPDPTLPPIAQPAEVIPSPEIPPAT